MLILLCFHCFQFVPLADIPTSLPSSTLFVTWSGRLLVVFANEKTSLRDHHSWLDSYTEPVSVYQYVQERFELLQNIPLHGVNCMERFKFAGKFMCLYPIFTLLQ